MPDDRFPIADRVEVKVGKTPYVRFDGNDYSVPHDRVRRLLTVYADQHVVRVIEGRDEVARHVRSFGKGRQIEDPGHVQALVDRKAEARRGRAMNRVFTAIPLARTLIERLAERGGNIGSAVAHLAELLDAFGAESVAVAIEEALSADSPHVAAVRQCLDRRRFESGKPTPIAVSLPKDPRVRDLSVRPMTLAPYEHLKPTTSTDQK